MKRLVPTGGKALGKYVEAEAEETVARVQEVKARIYENIVKLEKVEKAMTELLESE